VNPSASPEAQSGRVVHPRAAWLLLLLGFLTCGTAIYFMAFRPAMLPEDILFTKLDPRQMPTEAFEWLHIVFRTWGAFLLGFGILMVGIAAYILKQQPFFLRWAVAVAIVLSFGRFLISNWMLQSDYLWFIATLFALSAMTAVGFALPAVESPKSSADVRGPHPEGKKRVPDTEEP
jgi:hypothetical protein